MYQFRNRLDSLTLSNAGAVTFQTCCNKVGARDLLDCIVVPVTRNRYSYLLLLLFVLIHQFPLFTQYYSLFDFCFIFVEFYFDCCSKRKRTILNLTLFRYFDLVTSYPFKCSTSSSSRVNKHHTADSTDFVLV